MAKVNSLISEIARLRKKAESKYDRETVINYVSEAYLVGLHAHLVATGQLLEDVAWSELDANYRKVLHRQAEKLARSIVK